MRAVRAWQPLTALAAPTADFNLDFYLEAQNLKHLVRTMSDSPFNRKFK